MVGPLHNILVPVRKYGRGHELVPDGRRSSLHEKRIKPTWGGDTYHLVVGNKGTIVSKSQLGILLSKIEIKESEGRL